MPRGADDVSSRGKASSKPLPRSPKTAKGPSSPSIASPPRVAIVPGKAAKEDTTVRRKKSMRDYLRSTHGGFSNSKAPKLPSASDGPAVPQASEGSSTTQATMAHMGSFEENIYKQRIGERDGSRPLSIGEESRLRVDSNDKHCDSGDSGDSGPDISPPQGPMLPISPTGAPDNFRTDIDRNQSAGGHWMLERSHLQNQVFELRSKVHSLQSDIVDHDEYWKTLWERESRDRMYERNTLAEDLHAAQKEALDKRKQLLDLKQSISSLTHMENQVTDGEVAERMDGLYHRIRDWVVSNYRRSHPDVSSLSEGQLDRLPFLGPRSLKLDLRVWKINLYQAIAATVLVQIFQDEHCFGLPSDGPMGQIRSVARELKSTGLEYRKWHSSTIELLIRTSHESLVRNTEKLASEMIIDLLDILHAVTSVKATDAAYNTLDLIVREAVDISRLLRVQVPLYKVYLPRDEKFDESWMELTDEQDEEDCDNFVAFVVTPCIEKVSEESAGGLQSKRTIQRAKVVCLPE